MSEMYVQPFYRKHPDALRQFFIDVCDAIHIPIRSPPAEGSPISTPRKHECPSH